MNDPLTPPQAPVDTAEAFAERDGILFWIVAVGATLLSIALGFLASLALPAFKSVFIGFGADLPAPTKVLIQWPYSLWLPFVIAIGLWLYRHKWASQRQLRTRILVMSFLSLGLFSVGLFGLSIWALYLPIFKLGVAQ